MVLSFAIIMYDDLSLMTVVIPGVTKPAPHLMRGNPEATEFLLAQE